MGVEITATTTLPTRTEEQVWAEIVAWHISQILAIPKLWRITVSFIGHLFSGCAILMRGVTPQGFTE